MNLTPEQRLKAMGAGSAEALLDLAGAEGVALTPAPDRLMDGMTVNLGNETRCQGCGHQATFKVWNVSPAGGGYFVGKIECTVCHTIHENKNGTFEKASDQTRPGLGPVWA